MGEVDDIVQIASVSVDDSQHMPLREQPDWNRAPVSFDDDNYALGTAVQPQAPASAHNIWATRVTTHELTINDSSYGTLPRRSPPKAKQCVSHDCCRHVV